MQSVEVLNLIHDLSEAKNQRPWQLSWATRIETIGPGTKTKDLSGF